MKIIKKDNFARETVSDVLIAENICEYYGEIIVKSLNEKLGGRYSSDFFSLEQNDYKLFEVDY